MNYCKQKLLKKLCLLLTVLFSLTITGCVSKPRNTERVLPPRPERREINVKPESIRDYAIILAYYEYLVEEWEIWADTVEGVK